MAASISGVHKFIKDTSTPWNDKLKLARFAWQSEKCIIPNKEQVLLNWASTSIMQATKLQIGQQTVDRLWLYLHDVLGSLRLQTAIQRDGTPVSLRANFNQSLIGMLEKNIGNDQLVTILRCSRFILIYPTLAVILTSNLEKLLQLVIILMRISLKQVTEAGALWEDLRHVLEVALKNYASSMAKQTSSRRLHALTQNKLLIPSCQLLQVKSPDLINIQGQLEVILAQSVFNRDFYPGYVEYLTSSAHKHTKPTELKLIILQIHKFFEFLIDAVNSNKDVVECLYGTLPSLLTWFIASLKPSKNEAFTFFCKLCSVISICDDPIQSVPSDVAIVPSDVAMETEQTSPKKFQCLNWKLTLPCIEKMLQTIIDKDVYNVSTDAAHGKTMFTWFHCLVQCLLEMNSRFSSSWYRCLHLLLHLNHLLVESHMIEILTDGLFTVPSSDDDTAKQKFFDHLLQVYSKLRQFDKIVVMMLDTIRKSQLPLRNQQGWHQRFSMCIPTLTPGLSLEVWRLFLREITGYMMMPPDEPPSKKKRKSNVIVSESFEAIVLLLRTFILETPLISICSTTIHLEKVKLIMKDMSMEILGPLMRITQVKTDPTLCLSVLLLCHTWGEADLLLRQHTAYGLDQKLASAPEDSMEHGDLSYIHHYATSGEWRTVTTKWLDAGDRRIDGVLILLGFQQIRGLLLHSDIKQLTVENTIRLELCSILSYSEEISIPLMAKWNGQVSLVDVDEDSFGVAYVEMLTSKFPIMLPWLSNDQLMVLARLLIQNVAVNNCASEVVKQFLASGVYYESRSFQTSMVSVLLGQILKPIRRCVQKSALKLHKLQPIFDMADGDSVWFEFADTFMSDSKEGSANKMWSRIEAVTMALLAHCDKERSYSLSKKEMTELLQSVQLFHFLPLCHLQPGNHIRCLLILCFLDHVISQTANHKLHNVAASLLPVRSIMKTLCQVDLRGLFLKFLNGGQLLTSFASSLLNRSMSPAHEVDYQLRSVTLDIITALLTAAHKSNSENVVAQLSDWLLTELKETTRILKVDRATLKKTLNSIAALIAISTLFIRTKTTFAGLVKYNQKKMLEEIFIITNSSSEVVMLLQSPDIIKHWQQSSALSSKADSPEVTEDQLVNGTRSDAKHILLRIIIENSSAILAFTAEWFKVSDGDSLLFQRKWTGHFQPLLETILNDKVPHKDHIVDNKTTTEFFRRVCLVANVADVVSNKDLRRMWSRIVHYLKDAPPQDVKLCAQMILRCLDVPTFTNILDEIQTAITLRRLDELSYLLVALQLIPSADLSEDSCQVFNQYTTQIIHSLVSLLHALCPLTSSEVNHACDSIKAMTSILSQGNNILSSQLATTPLHAVHLFPLNDLPSSDFAPCFTVLFQLLDTLLLQYPRSVIASLPSFLDCIKYLLRAVMFRARDDVDSHTDKVPEKSLLSCAEDMDRLLTLLASHKEEVQKVAIFVVSEYIDQLQKGTLHPAVKKSLANGMNNLVAVCDDKSLALLGSILPDNLKEIYKGFYADYRNYFKYTGRV